MGVLQKKLVAKVEKVEFIVFNVIIMLMRINFSLDMFSDFECLSSYCSLPLNEKTFALLPVSCSDARAS